MAPAVSYASIDKLDKNTSISIYGKTGGWYYGEGAGGKLGYISESYVKVTGGDKQENTKSQDRRRDCSEAGRRRRYGKGRPGDFLRSEMCA